MQRFQRLPLQRLFLPVDSVERGAERGSLEDGARPISNPRSLAFRELGQYGAG
jgi:hypothetical protein